MKKFASFWAIALAVTLTACGGGGGSPGSTAAGGTGTGGTTPGGATGGTGVTLSAVTDFVLFLDKSTLSNSGTATAQLTVLAVDANNNVVPNAAVSVATDANSVFVPSGTSTDAQGQYTGKISAGADKTDRQVTATVTVNGIVKQTSLQIVGSQIALTLTPALPSPGLAATVTARITDAGSQPVAGKTVTFAGDIVGLTGRQVLTDANGTAKAGFTAPTVAGSYLVRASGSGVFSESTVQVGTAAMIPAAVIPAGAQPALAVTPTVLAPNTVGSSANQAQLRFLFLDAANQPIPNVRVRFNVSSTGLGSTDSSISTGDTTVYTNASGVATAAFIPGSTGSPTNGVQVRACFKAIDFTSTTECPGIVNVALTIAAQALAVTIGNDNLLAPGPGTYIKQFVVMVADSAGRAVPNAEVGLSLDITHYGKGTFLQTPTFSLNAGDIYNYIPDATTTPAAFGARVSCRNEDFNRNGFVDFNENTNTSVDSSGQPTLEPRRSDMIISYVDPAVTKTNARGILLIQVEYSQRFATWLSYRIKATTNVSGSQGTAERAFVTTYIDADEPTGSFRTAPYGTSSCSSPN